MKLSEIEFSPHIAVQVKPLVIRASNCLSRVLRECLYIGDVECNMIRVSLVRASMKNACSDVIGAD